MTRDDIVRLAQDAAIMPPNWGATENQWRSLEEFAKLVAKHTLANIDPSSFMSWQEGHEAGKQTEREACAKLCDQMEADSEGTECCKWPTPSDCAEAIRARSNT